MVTRFFRTLTALFATALISACASTAPTHSFRGETADLAEVTADALKMAEQIGPANMLVVFDIDNTLLAMEQGLGADQWYEWQKELNEKNPCDARLAGNRFAVQGALYFASAMRPAQENAAVLVREVQDAGIPVIALTSRGVDYRLQTFRELRRNGYSFVYSGIGSEGGFPDNFVPPSGSRPARYEDGVFLTSGQHKGAMLHDLLDLTATDMPRVIVMTDDNQVNLDAVTETFAALNATVRTWRYSGEDTKVAGFDPDAAHELWTTIEPALRTLQEQLGPDNYELPAITEHPECQEND